MQAKLPTVGNVCHLRQSLALLQADLRELEETANKNQVNSTLDAELNSAFVLKLVVPIHDLIRTAMDTLDIFPAYPNEDYDSVILAEVKDPQHLDSEEDTLTNEQLAALRMAVAKRLHKSAAALMKGAQEVLLRAQTINGHEVFDTGLSEK